MDLWATHFEKLLTWVLRNPPTRVELLVVAVAAIFAFLLVMTNVGDLLGATMSTASRSFILLAVSLATWLLATTACFIYVAPQLPADFVAGVPVACAALVALVISAPLTHLFQKTGYAKGLILVILSVAAAIAVILLVGAAFRMVRETTKEGGRVKARTSEVNDFLSK